MSSDTIISLNDIIASNREEEENAAALLGNADADNCSFPFGYIRQPIYSCRTCFDGLPAGVCLACSYHCHADHDLVELYTKRDFRCDCGLAPLSKRQKCLLLDSKDAASFNSANKYNHNFNGSYCYCGRPYPDLQDSVDDVMIQCVVCEDWFHGRHLFPDADADADANSCATSSISLSTLQLVDRKLRIVNEAETSDATVVIVDGCSTELPDDDAYAEVICGRCAAQRPWLYIYGWFFAVNRGFGAYGCREDSNIAQLTSDNQTASAPKAMQDSPDSQLFRVSNSFADIVRCDNFSEDSRDNCFLETLKQCMTEKFGVTQLLVLGESALFWPEDWRDRLCTCVQCIVRYEEAECMFLTDRSDTLAAYEERGAAKSTGLPAAAAGGEQPIELQEVTCAASADATNAAPAAVAVATTATAVPTSDPLLDALSGMDQFQQLNLVSGFRDLKEQLSVFLKSFADENRVVTKEDIQNFFEQFHTSHEVRKRAKFS